ncbi:MAG: AAA family ATPase [Methylococcaceae bacterium]|nr:AAA family ATPase [Methylococcaceae bacterium]
MPDNQNQKTAPAALDPSFLYRHCDPGLFLFANTSELEDQELSVGQSRAIAALDFGVKIPDRGYNLYVLGRSGSHRHLIVEEFLKSRASTKGTPCDWCYLNNFDDERKPIVVSLPAGKGLELRDELARLIDELCEAIPAAFSSDQYRSSLDELNQEYEERYRSAIEAIQDEAKKHDTSLVPTPHGFAIAPMNHGELLSDEQFEKLDANEKQRRTQAMAEISAKLRQHLEGLPKWHKEHRDRIKQLDREFSDRATGLLIDQLIERFRDFPQLEEYLSKLRENILENARDFHPAAEQAPQLPEIPPKDSLVRYRVNLLVDHSRDRNVPIVYESNPSIQNLLGRVDHVAQFGMLVTNFTMIRPGALHKANGGFLILDADRVLMEPLAWSALKRTLSAGTVRIESLGELLSLVSTASIEPSEIPLDLKVILIGERRIYYLLCEYDPDFSELFKVAADFDNRIDRTRGNTLRYAQLIGNLARREGLLPLSREAVARTIEHSARLQGDAEKLTTKLRDVLDLVREASFLAKEDHRQSIGAEHVQLAIDSQIYRLDRLRSEIQEEIQRNGILIDTDGAEIGQVNGLSVLGLGNFSFGQPSRITANVHIGDGNIVDIERETELGGPIHSKGVLILASYLRSRYAVATPLSISASLVFEQSYGGVEGDSASVAETCALLSAIAKLPIRQSLAVTGSVNQLGQVQIIGGVNEKIEGFFDTCRARGLTGTQGVLIPKDNIQHLMLRREVVDAARAGRFSVFPIETVDDAIGLLTGVPAGERDSAGNFPEGSVNFMIETNLKKLAERYRDFEHQADTKPRRKRKSANQADPDGETS